MNKNILIIPRGSFQISIEELRKQLKGGNVNVGKDGVTASKAGAVKVPEGTFHSSGINGINGINGIFRNVGTLLGLGGSLIANMNERLAANRGARGSSVRDSSSVSRVASGASAAAAHENAGVGGQWYEKDAARFEIEVKEMDNRGFRLIDLYDGRIGFEKIDADNSIKIMVVCDWQYPLKPPAVYVESEDAVLKLKKNADGSLALFTRYMPWKSDMAVCTVIEYFEEKLEMLKELKSDSANASPAQDPPENL